MIRQPIEQRNTGKGNPSAMLHFDRPLNKRQEKLLERLPEFDSRATVRKRDVSMRDLSVWALKGNERAIKFYERYGFRFNGTEQEIKLGTPNTELRMVYERD